MKTTIKFPMRTVPNFTKGEWKILWGNYTHFATINTDVLHRICAIENDNPNEIDELRANAKLISAAPDLLEICMELFNLLEEHEPDWYLRGHYNKAIKAINKATTPW
jgi:hypothetical protein